MAALVEKKKIWGNIFCLYTSVKSCLNKRQRVIRVCIIHNVSKWMNILELYRSGAAVEAVGLYMKPWTPLVLLNTGDMLKPGAGWRISNIFQEKTGETGCFRQFCRIEK